MPLHIKWLILAIHLDARNQLKFIQLYNIHKNVYASHQRTSFISNFEPKNLIFDLINFELV